MTGACQKAALRCLASTTVTWQRYSPGCSFSSGKLNCSCVVFSRFGSASAATSGEVAQRLLGAGVGAHAPQAGRAAEPFNEAFAHVGLVFHDGDGDAHAGVSCVTV